jgi:hypothetical protein
MRMLPSRLVVGAVRTPTKVTVAIISVCERTVSHLTLVNIVIQKFCAMIVWMKMMISVTGLFLVLVIQTTTKPVNKIVQGEYSSESHGWRFSKYSEGGPFRNPSFRREILSLRTTRA